LRSGEAWENRQVYQEFPPRCRCGALLRPAVLWFGESYDPQLFNRAVAAAAKAEYILVAGTSGQVWIVSGLIDAAPRAKVAEFNLETTETGQQADHLILGPSGETLPRLVERLKRGKADGRLVK
ncbi:MAG TPA: Sir2 family NAD-dependent protein deacetylase, partial [Candidatus Obscuribacterales bacterium]